MSKTTLTLAFILFPIFSHAQVLFSEIAWMGTDTDANNEWIEIYNFSNTPTDLSGWTIEGELTIALSGILPPHGVVILERTDDDTLPGTAFFIYTGDLPNAGGTLTIKDPQGNTSDEAVGGTNWSNIGGSNIVPKKTAQRTRMGAWVTASPTPSAENAEVSEELEEEIFATTTTQENVTRSSGGGSSRKTASVSKTEDFEENPELKLSVTAPKTAYVNQPVVFESVPTGVGRTIERSLKYTWNFGDTYTDIGKNPTHTFTHTGEYVVFLEGTFGSQYATARHEVKVLPVSFTMTQTQMGEIRIENSAPHEVDIGGFMLTGTRTFIFPKFTILKSKGSLTVGGDRIGSTHTASLYDNAKVRVATLGQAPTPVRAPVLVEKITSNSITEETPVAPRGSTIETPSQKIIQIGAIEEPISKKGNMFARIFGGFARFFGL